MAQFTIQNLTFAYPTAPEKPVLDKVSLTVEKGSYMVLCGKSGSGKTTLLRHLKSVLTPHGMRNGEILLNGIPLSEVDLLTQSAKIGYVMQNPDSQIVTDKVWHELAFGLESLGVEQKTMRLRVAEMASYFGIQNWFHRDIAELSGGQKQLLNLASIMAMQPEVLILDEPTSQLDPIAAADFLATVRRINRELGTTILITEHRLEDVFHAADRCVVLEEGHVIADDTPKKVGQLLHESGSDMFAAMPAPMRIYYGCGQSGAAPLTVREGRVWLDDFCTGTSAAALPAEPVFTGAEKPFLRCKDLWYRYEKDAPDVLRGVSFDVPKGSLYAIVGGNGTGKSTTLKAICGICKPYRGKVLLDGVPIGKDKNLFRGNLCMLPQDPQSLFTKSTVLAELQEMETDVGHIDSVAALCEITPLLQNHPCDLSGGEQQRVALAKVLLTHPRLLLLDEPTKGLDNFFKQKLLSILCKLKAQDVTIVMVSHDVEFCAAGADLVSLFFDGQILTTNTPRRFFAANSFYTTAANRMGRHRFPDAVTTADLVTLIREGLQ